MRPAVAKLVVEIVAAHPAWRGKRALVRRVLQGAAEAEEAEGVVSVLLGDDAALRALNETWRGKGKATNVLSFPAATSSGGRLGDIALAAETIDLEARTQGKTFEAHMMHLLVHGLLHLLGYDHEEDSEAEVMEAREREILADLGVADPYAAEVLQ